MVESMQNFRDYLKSIRILTLLGTRSNVLLALHPRSNLGRKQQHPANLQS